MSDKRQVKREDLRRRLIEAAHERIRTRGIAGLRARDIAADAGCALGGLYTVFHDLDDLILHANSRTLAALGQALGEAVGTESEPGRKLKILAQTYLRFARENRNHWAALFKHRLAPDETVPDWHLAQQTVLFQYLVEPLAQIRPDLDRDTVTARARTYFAALHGIVVLNMEERFIALPRGQLEQEIDRFVDVLIEGNTKTDGG